MTKKNNIIFLVSANTSMIGVLESQVFNLANHLSDDINNNVKVIIIGNTLDINFSSYSKNLEFHYLDKTIFIDEIRDSRVYIRSIDVFLKNYLTLKIKHNQVIYDFRALLFIESFSRNRNYLTAALIFFFEMISYLLADEVCCVSNNLKNKLYSYFLIKKKIFVFPCLVVSKKESK